MVPDTAPAIPARISTDFSRSHFSRFVVSGILYKFYAISSGSAIEERSLFAGPSVPFVPPRKTQVSGGSSPSPGTIGIPFPESSKKGINTHAECDYSYFFGIVVHLNRSKPAAARAAERSAMACCYICCCRPAGSGGVSSGNALI